MLGRRLPRLSVLAVLCPEAPYQRPDRGMVEVRDGSVYGQMKEDAE